MHIANMVVGMTDQAMAGVDNPAGIYGKNPVSPLAAAEERLVQQHSTPDLPEKVFLVKTFCPAVFVEVYALREEGYHLLISLAEIAQGVLAQGMA